MDRDKNEKMKKVRRRSELSYHLIVFPGLFFLILFSYIPMVGLLMAFQDFVPAKGLFRSEFVGLKHFTYMFQLPDIGKIIRNTLVIALGKMMLGMVIAIAFAILLNEVRIKIMKKTVQTIVYLPHFLSWVVLASVVTNMFGLDGSVNQVLASLGLEKVNFLGNSRVFPSLIIGTDVWLPIILLMTATNLTSILSAGFDQIYNLYSPLVYETGDVLDTYVYRIGLVGRQYSFGAAVGLCRSIVGMVLLLSSNALTKKLTDQKIF